MKVTWSPLALHQRKETARYIRKEFGQKATKKFHQNVLQWVSLIAANPDIGPKEPLLQGKQWEYRSIVISRQNKLVYYAEGDTLYIAALWDTRREPRAQADNVK